MKTNITKHTRTAWTGKILAALVGFALLTAGSPAFAGNGNDGNSHVVPPQSHSYGQSYAEWAKRFWSWAEPSWFRQLMHAFLPATAAHESVRADHSMPEMIHLVNLILEYQGTSSAFSKDALGRVQLTHLNDYDVAALNAVHARWDAEVSSLPGRNFDAAFWEFKEKLQAVAVPAFTLNNYNYFAVPFLPSEAASMERLQFFIRYSQHNYVPSMKCPRKFMAAQGLPWENGTICCFVDPNWAGKDANPLLTPRIFGATAGYNWASTTGTGYAVTQDPDAPTSFDARGASKISLTAYRAAGVTTYMTVGDTAAFHITYNGIDKGMWKAQVIETTATGSRATYLLMNRI